MAEIIDISPDVVRQLTWDELINGLGQIGLNVTPAGQVGSSSPNTTNTGGANSPIGSDLSSSNYKAGSIGWKLFSNGNLEASNGTFRGSITASTGTIGGWVINSDNIKDVAGTTGLSSTVTVGDDIRFWAGHATPSSAPFRVTEAGVLTATSGTIGGWTLSSSELSSGKVKLQSTAERILIGDATAPLTGTGIFIGKDGTDYEFRVGDPSGKYIHFDGATGFTLNGMYISQAVLASIAAGSALEIQNWQFTGVFSATDYRVVAWTAGTLTLADGTTYSIDAGNTGNIAATTYIYFSLVASTTVLQKSTTASNAVGAGKVLICVASPNAITTSKATFQVFGGTGGVFVNGTQIADSSISSGQVVDGAITSGKSNLALRGWTQTCVFSSASNVQVNWGSGTFTASDGTAYSISASNTGTMSAKTYIYLDIAVSTTAYQTTTTAATAVGDGKVLVAIAQNNTTEAVFNILNNASYNIDASNIVAGSITSNEIAASTITASNIASSTITATQIAASTITATQIAANTITASQIAASTITANEIAGNTITANKLTISTLSSIAADLGTITAGNMTINSSGYIKGGQSGYNTGTGFFLGYDSSAYKFSLGDGTSSYLTWDGSQLSVTGVSIIDAPITNLMTIGENITVTTPVPVYIKTVASINEYVSIGLQVLSTTTSACYAAIQVSQSILVGAGFNRISRVTLYLTKVGSPTGNVNVNIFACDANDKPTGVSLGTSSVLASSTSTGEVVFTFTSAIVVSPSTKYCIVYSCPSGDASNHVQYTYRASNPYGDGAMTTSADSGASWSAASTNDMYFRVFGFFLYAVGSCVACDDTNTEKLAYTGMLLESATLGDTKRIQFSGIVSNFANLRIGSTYYLKKGAESATSTLSQTSTALEWKIGEQTARIGVGQTFTTGAVFNLLKSIVVQLKHSGSTPTDYVQCKVYASDKTTLIATSTNTVDGSTLTTSFSTHTFTFNDVALAVSTQYFFELTRTGSFDMSKYYLSPYGTGTAYSGGASFYSSGSPLVWTGTGGANDDLYFVINLMEANASGDIAPTAGSNSVKVGRAISATQLLIYQLAI